MSFSTGSLKVRCSKARMLSFENHWGWELMNDSCNAQGILGKTMACRLAGHSCRLLLEKKERQNEWWRKGDRKGRKQKAGIYFPPHIIPGNDLHCYGKMPGKRRNWWLSKECGFFKWLSLLQDDKFYEIINPSVSN